MLIPTIIMGVIAIALLYLAYQKGGGEHITGLKNSGNILLQILPLIVFAVIIAGLVQVLLPTELISRWIGTESGLRGVLIGTVLGGIAPGAPYISMPIAAGMLRLGSGIGTMVAFIAAWGVISFARLPLEIGIMGWKFTAIRFICCLFLPPIAGLLANLFFSRTSVV